VGGGGGVCCGGESRFGACIARGVTWRVRALRGMGRRFHGVVDGENGGGKKKVKELNGS